MADHHHGEHDHDHHHHGDDYDIQCNHSEGVACIGDEEFMNDPIFQKAEWSVDDWTEMYSKMPTSRNKGRPTPQLVKYIREVLPTEPRRVLLPLCGRTPDLRWLYERGNTVVGIEAVEKPVKEFFELYSDLKHTVKELPFGKLYKSEDERLLIYVCNILKMPVDALGQFDMVFDWGSYVAISEEDRKPYVDLVTATLKKDYRYFLELCHDGPTAPNTCMPNSVPLRTVKLEFGPSHQLRLLETKDIAAAWKVDSFFNSYILMSPPKEEK